MHYGIIVSGIFGSVQRCSKNAAFAPWFGVFLGLSQHSYERHAAMLLVFVAYKSYKLYS